MTAEELQTLLLQVEAALEAADRSGLHDVGIGLDVARLAIEARLAALGYGSDDGGS